MTADPRAEDREARRLAQEHFDSPLVLEAGAGTGKTATLVARVVCWCLGPGWDRAREELDGGEDEAIARRALEGVVAITFTEAAAAEMAERIGLALAGLEQGDALPPGLEDESLRPAGPELRGERARALLASLDRLTVRTIHAFCLRLLAEHPLEAGLPPRFEVDADGSALGEFAREAVEECLREDSAERRALLELAVREVQPETVVDALAGLVGEGLPPEELARDRYDDASVEAMRRGILSGLRAFEQGPGACFVGAKGHARWAGDALHELAGWLDRFEAAPPGRESLIAAARELDDKAAGRFADWLDDKFSNAERKIAGGAEPAIRSALEAPLPLLQALRSVDLELLDAARAVLGPLAAQVLRRLHGSGLVSYSDLLRLARDLLAENPLVRGIERGRIRQLLVDEFQDTDRVQCELVEQLALGDGEGPGLFLVGDPKQSIYGWRNADLAAYDEFKERVKRGGGRVEGLQVNFRSVPAVLDEVQRVVEPVMHAEPKVQPPFQLLLPSADNQERSGYEALGRSPIEHWDTREWDRESEDGGGPGPRETKAGPSVEIEAAAIARDIAELHLQDGRAFGEFAILQRTVTHQERYLEALRDRGIPFEVGKDKSYYRRREVIDAGALVRAVLDPHDHLALLTWLRSPAVGLPDAALIPLWAGRFPDLCTRLAEPGGASAARLDVLVEGLAGRVDTGAPGFEAIAGWDRSLLFALRALAHLRAAFETLAPDEFVEQLRSLTALEATEAARWLGHYRAANLDRFFRELGEELLDAGKTRHDVLRRLRRAVSEERDAEEARPSQEQPDAVQVMTIHAAKGLDFGQVYLPYLQGGPRSGSSRGSECSLTDSGWELKLFGQSSPGWSRAEAASEAVSVAERVRLLYVAVTRAKRRVVFSGQIESAKQTARTKSMSALLASREGGRGDWLGGARNSGSDAQGHCRWSERDAAWVVCNLADREDPPARVGEGEGGLLPSAAEAASAAAALSARRERAQQRSARPLVGAASGLADETQGAARHEARAEELLGGAEELPAADREGDTPAPARRAASLERGAARAAGTAVHRLLETVSLGEGREALQAGRSDAEAHARALAPPREADEAAAALRELVDRTLAGACAERLLELGEAGVLARELPILLEASEQGPVGCIAGSIDLVYREEEAVVVADYKSDRVETEEEIAQAVAHHAPQVEVYRRAVQRALRLDAPPRAELWFLWPGRIVEVPLGGS